MTIAELLAPSGRLAPFYAPGMMGVKPTKAKKISSFNYVKEVHAVHTRTLAYLDSITLDRKLQLGDRPRRATRPR